MRLSKPRPIPEDASDGYLLDFSIDDLKEGKLVSITISGELVLITKVNNAVKAFSADCPHAAGNLAKGSYYKGRIDCPDHGYRFDVLTGRALWPKDEVCRLRFFRVREEDGAVKVWLS